MSLLSNLRKLVIDYDTYSDKDFEKMRAYDERLKEVSEVYTKEFTKKQENWLDAVKDPLEASDEECEESFERVQKKIKDAIAHLRSMHKASRKASSRKAQRSRKKPKRS